MDDRPRAVELTSHPWLQNTEKCSCVVFFTSLFVLGAFCFFFCFFFFLSSSSGVDERPSADESTSHAWLQNTDHCGNLSEAPNVTEDDEDDGDTDDGDDDWN